MARVSGTPKKISIAGINITIPADVDIKFWAGGPVVSETMEDNNGPTAKVMQRSGKLTGVTARVFTSDGTLAAFMDLVTRAGAGEEFSTLVELADGGKWSAPCHIIVSDEGPYSSADATFSYDLVATKTAGGKFVKL